MTRRGNAQAIMLVVVAAVVLTALLMPDRDRGRPRAEQPDGEARTRVAALEGLVKAQAERIDYLETREAAQVVLNRTFIDHATKAEARLRAIEGRPHKVDGQEAETIPATNLPTVPPDRD